MAEESLQEVRLLLGDKKYRSLLNSLYNVYYYSMEAFLFREEVHCRSHEELKKSFLEKIHSGAFHFTGISADPATWDSDLETIFKTKRDNEKGILPSPMIILSLIQRGERFFEAIKLLLLGKSGTSPVGH